MTVTGITEKDKKRVSVSTDEGCSFTLYKGELDRYGIVTGGELPAPVYEEITGVLLVKRAKIRAMKLLEHHDYTEKTLRDKLSEGGYTEGAVDAAISYVKSYRYIDDERYARNYCEGRMTRKSRAVIKNELVSRGIDRETIEKVLDEAYSDEE